MQKTYSPKLKHGHENWNVQHVHLAADVEIPDHDQAFAQFQRGFLGEIHFPVGLENFLQLTSVDLWRVFQQELIYQDLRLRLKENWITLKYRKD